MAKSFSSMHHLPSTSALNTYCCERVTKCEKSERCEYFPKALSIKPTIGLHLQKPFTEHDTRSQEKTSTGVFLCTIPVTGEPKHDQ